MEEETREVEIWRQRAEALRSALRLNTLHWDGAITRAREMFAFLSHDKKDLMVDDGQSDSFLVNLPPCPKCGGSTDWQVQIEGSSPGGITVSCQVEGCGWEAALEIVGHEAPPVVHELKTWPVPFQATKAGDKTMELRPDDREPRFAPGHRLHLREWRPDTESYTGGELLMEVTAVYREESAVPKGHALLAVSRAAASDWEVCGLSNDDLSI